ncbi:MAG TPA: ribosome biogenesis GTPase Der, partial [Coleofasciculaceae cyanobacterium]
MPLPVIAIIGRPNVGKSTLVNRLTGMMDAIVHDEPGVTRDRTYREAFWRDRDFVVVDTGGLVFDDDTDFLPLIREQAMLALAEASAAIFVVDGQAGPNGADETIATWLRQQSVPVLVAVNKCESPDQGLMQAAEFWRLGLGEPFAVSGIHGNGTGELLDELLNYLPSTEIIEASDEIRVAIVGRPNVGKSSLLNAFVGENRAIVSPVSGTTRDTIDMIVERGEQRYRLIDTAGIRKKKQVEYGPEFFGINRSFKAIRRSDVVLLVIDALDGVTEQDQKLAGRIADDGRACVVVVNKWDA